MVSDPELTDENGNAIPQDAVSRFKRWMHENEYEEAVEICPYNGREGGYQGAVDAWEVAEEYLGELDPEPSEEDHDKVMDYAMDVGQFSDPKIWGNSVCMAEQEEIDEEEWMVEQAIRDSEDHPTEEEIEASMATISDVDIEKCRLSAEDMVKLGVAPMWSTPTPFTRSDLQGQLPVVYNGKTAEEWHHKWAQEVLKKLETTYEGKTAEEWHEAWFDECHRG